MLQRLLTTPNCSEENKKKKKKKKSRLSNLALQTRQQTKREKQCEVLSLSLSRSLFLSLSLSLCGQASLLLIACSFFPSSVFSSEVGSEQTTMKNVNEKNKRPIHPCNYYFHLFASNLDFQSR
jgi:hypothetical protein